MKGLFSFLLAVLALAACTNSVSADPLRIVTLNLAPYGFAENDAIHGIAHEICVAIAQEAGFTPEESLGTIGRGVADLSTGHCDALIMLNSPEIEEVSLNLGSVFPVETVLIGLRTLPLRSLEDAYGKKVAAVKDARYDPRINDENGFVIYPTDGYAHSFKMLMARRVDLVIGPKLGLMHTARKLELPRSALGEPLVLSSMHAYLFVPRDMAVEKVRRLEKARQRLLDDGTIQGILEKYSL